MQQVLDFFLKLFDTSDFPARWHCGRWTDFHGWLYIISDLLIWSAYFAIPLLIFNYIRKKEVPFHRVFYLFGTFIFACGTTHLLDALIFWEPLYRLSALVRLGTGIVSWLTVLTLLQVLPIAFAMRTSTDFEKEIEKRKTIEQELNKNNHLLNHAQQIAKLGHWEWRKKDGVQIQGSTELRRIYGISNGNGSLLYEDFLQRTHPDDQPQMIADWRVATQKGHLEPAYYRIINDAQQYIHVLVRGDAIVNEGGEITGLIGTVQDVSQIRRNEEDLLHKTRELESKVAELKRFAFIASHDLKEPLRKISVFASRFREIYSETLPPKGLEYLQKIQDNAGRQQQLVDEIMQLSQLADTEDKREWSSLNSLAQEACDDLELLIRENDALVDIGTLPQAFVVPVQIRILFQNLINNALKFRRPEQRSEIHISGDLVSLADLGWPQEVSDDFSIMNDPNFRKREQYCRLVVRDNGIGFSPEYATSIFEIFRRLHGQEYAGTGLGLAICKQIVDNHRGLITATGRPGEGATFTMYLPVASGNLPS